MRAVLADIAVQRYLYTAAAQKLPKGKGKNAGWGPGCILRLVEDEPAPRLPDAPGWVRLRPELSLICGSDVGLAHAKVSLVLSAFYAETQQIPGHEFVAVVDEVGPGVTRVQEGDRVAVEAVISCAQRGFDPRCRNCAAGKFNICERFDMPGRLGMRRPHPGLRPQDRRWLVGAGDRARVPAVRHRLPALQASSSDRARIDHASRGAALAWAGRAGRGDRTRSHRAAHRRETCVACIRT
jgi:Alcohol dehydrogenase GroES-like domain